MFARSDVAYRRAAIMRAGATVGITVFGNMPPERLNMPGVAVKGPVSYGPEMARLYSNVKVNLNLTAAQLRQAVNQRVFDASAAGGFVLTDYRSDLEDLFDLEQEIACFKNFDEMAGMLEWYGKDAQARKKIITAARRRVLAHHSWDKRLAGMLAWLRDM